MQTIKAFKDPELAKTILSRIAQLGGQKWTLMEVCGGQTHSIIKHGLDRLLPDNIRLIHGPGCPVCVTPVAFIDKALAIAAKEKVIFCSYGDMLRVPGSTQDLLGLKALGADIRIIYSALDAIKMAQNNPQHEVVFFAVGFETSAPMTALIAMQARQLKLTNFSLLVCHVCVPPVMTALLQEKDNQVQGFLAAGHVCAVMGIAQYLPIAEQFKVPIVVTGFEPVDILQGIYQTINQLQSGRYQVENAYRRVVRDQGNAMARQQMQQALIAVDRHWRGIGEIPQSGLALAPEFSNWNAEEKFDVRAINPAESDVCRSGEVLKGVLVPSHCPEFGTGCTPEHPLGATMVSSEGACAAYYRYRKNG